MGKRSLKNRKSTVKNTIQTTNSTGGNRSKKANNVFKITDTKHTKKAKEVHGKLKQIKNSMGKKLNDIDDHLKVLHKDLVIKQKNPNTNTASLRSSSSAIIESSKICNSIQLSDEFTQIQV